MNVDVKDLGVRDEVKRERGRKGKVTRGVARADAWTLRLHRGYRFMYRIRS